MDQMINISPSSKVVHKTRSIVLKVAFILILLTIFTPLLLKKNNNNNLYHSYAADQKSSTRLILGKKESSSSAIIDEDKKSNGNGKCDIFTGEWVANPEAPYYTNKSCWAIHEHQNCIKYGRPDTDFIKWRWKPDGCELPIFNPSQFLEIVRGKRLAFVGDSVARNQMQSLICLLSRVEYPIDVSYTPDEYFKRWFYKTYNFTLATFWTPFLVKAKENDPNGPNGTGLFGLYLDEPDQKWATQIDEFDYVVVSVGHWFHRPLMYYENGHLIGCRFCNIKNLTDYPMSYGYQRAFHTAFKAILGRESSFKGVTYLRTFAPSHFEGGEWNKGGNCLRKKPYRSNEVSLEGINLDLYIAQMKELKVAQRRGRERGLKFRVIDATQAMLLRPDGHPSRYGHWPEEKVALYNDCVHWCLPGPIDTWNDFLLEMLKKERATTKEENLMYLNQRKMRIN
ncbi:Protein trichome birefringence-like 19 [Dionaea muscipula]